MHYLVIVNLPRLSHGIVGTRQQLTIIVPSPPYQGVPLLAIMPRGSNKS